MAAPGRASGPARSRRIAARRKRHPDHERPCRIGPHHEPEPTHRGLWPQTLQDRAPARRRDAGALSAKPAGIRHRAGGRWAPAPRPWCACSPSWATTAMRRAQTEARAEVTARLASPGERADAMGADGHGARACLHNALLHDQHNCRRPSPRWIRRCSRPRCALTQRKARVHVLGLRQPRRWPATRRYLNLCLPTVRPLATQGRCSWKTSCYGWTNATCCWPSPSGVLGGGGQALRVFRERGARC